MTAIGFDKPLFAMSRTSLWEPLVSLRQGKAGCAGAVRAIADRYREFAEIFKEVACAAV